MRTLGQQKEVFAFFFFGVLVYCAKAGRAYVTHYATVRRPYLFAIVQTRNPDSSHRDDNNLKTDISLQAYILPRSISVLAIHHFWTNNRPLLGIYP